MTELYTHESGNGFPLLLIHGFPFDHRIWLKMLPYLEGCHALAPDLPGFGKSALHQPPGTLTMDFFADALRELMDTRKIEKVVMAGHSMGGYIALAFARKYANRLAGLALVASHPAADPPPKRAARAAQADEVLHRGPETLATTMPPALTPNIALHASLAEIIRQQQPEVIAAALRGMAIRPPAFDLLPHLADLPIALITGERDAVITPDLYEKMVQALPQAHTLRLPGGHMPMLEFPAETAAALKAICPS